MIYNWLDETLQKNTELLQRKSFAEGNSYYYRNYLTYSANEIKYFVWDPTSIVANRVIVLTPDISATAGPVRCNIFAGGVASSTNGTELLVVNRNATSTNVSSVDFRLNPTLTSTGVKFTGILIPAAAKVTPGTAATSAPFEVDISQKYILEIINDNGDNTVVELLLSWAEIRS